MSQGKNVNVILVISFDDGHTTELPMTLEQAESVVDEIHRATQLSSNHSKRISVAGKATINCRDVRYAFVKPAPNRGAASV